MAEPTALNSLEALAQIAEAVPMTGKERDVTRWHIQNVSKALQPPEMPVSPVTPPDANGRSAE